MRVVIAPDKFKGSLSAPEAALAIARGVAAAAPGASIDLVPMADGGEGTVEALVAATGGLVPRGRRLGSAGRARPARFGMLGDGRTAVVEMAAASGLTLDRSRPARPVADIDPGDGRAAPGGRRGRGSPRDPRDRRQRDQRRRGGARPGARLPPARARRRRPAARRRCPGAARSHRPERARPEARGGRGGRRLRRGQPALRPSRGLGGLRAPEGGVAERWSRSSTATSTTSPGSSSATWASSIRDLPGAGAAGGLGGGLVAFASGTLEPGVALVLGAVGLADRLRDADLCLTGEGAIDASSAFGKTAVGVARLARSLGCPTLALAGTIGPGAEAVLDEGIDAYFSICPGPISLDEAIAQAVDAPGTRRRGGDAGLPRGMETRADDRTSPARASST